MFCCFSVKCWSCIVCVGLCVVGLRRLRCVVSSLRDFVGCLMRVVCFMFYVWWARCLSCLVRRFFLSFFFVRCVLYVVRCSLSLMVVCFYALPFDVWCCVDMLFVACWLLRLFYRMLFVDCCALFVADCALFVVRCSWFVVCRLSTLVKQLSLCVVSWWLLCWWLLFVARLYCLLFVGCCWAFARLFVCSFVMLGCRCVFGCHLSVVVCRCYC